MKTEKMKIKGPDFNDGEPIRRHNFLATTTLMI